MRDSDFERAWLEHVCRAAGLSGLIEDFTRAVNLRLAKGAVEYGEGSFMEKGHELLGEVSEEAVDIASWGVLYAQFLRAQGDESAMHASVRILNAAAYSLRAWHEIQQAREIF